MLTQRMDEIAAVTRRDAVRLGIAAVALIVVLTVILGASFFPQPVQLAVGDVATADIVAPRATEYVSEVLTAEKRQAAADAVDPVYSFTEEKAAAIAGQQLRRFDAQVRSVDQAFADGTTDEQRLTLLQAALPGLSEEARETLLALTAEEWQEVRTEAARVLEKVESEEIRDSDVIPGPSQLAGDFVLGTPQRTLAAEIVAPLIIPNSSLDQAMWQAAKDEAAESVEPETVRFAQGQVIVRRSDRITAAQLEAIDEFELRTAQPDVVRLLGWLFLSILVVGLTLGWIWRFRRDLWHRNNALLLIGMLVVGAAFVLKATAGRPGLPYVVPTAVVGILLAILLDAGVATLITVVISILAGSLNDNNALELTVYTLVGGLAGIIAIRRGDRLQVFVQAGLAVAISNVLVVSTFAMLGLHDARGLFELVGASVASAAGAAVAAVGSFAVLGKLFGILTVIQLLELANPSQPLLRRLLVETPGTYHHSLMVGNLAERAAEAIGADPLLTRVAAYYHDIGKLSNPLAFIENQAGGENIHDQLDPEVSAQVLKQHVADGIDIAYKNKLPKSLIAFIPQHHGTAIMSYFYARARGLAAVPFGGLETVDGAKAAGAIADRRFRHAGPKPQSKEAALLMLADGVEASVRSLASRDEAAIRAMVARIIEERLTDGQFDECDLTLRDLERIKEAFVGQLLGMYHQRIAYPQNKVVEIESRRGTGTGSGA
ncbi:MAG TPA: HDIG domain-containing protein [Candidatus Limnocylindrales bacterium]|nr:HDIG domain-containing protein [Candidatus Limnocylindrales bacterium]